MTKAVPLTISRGNTAAVVKLDLRLERDGLVGRGETGGFETGHRAFLCWRRPSDQGSPRVLWGQGAGILISGEGGAVDAVRVD